ncbi:hypothetical protein SIO70_23295 [Chitinophaga sancti]|uniref:hypothetical protein n=1 Tax=Chitinophaga sancti TaxID=1004 RepID=UPI002A7525F7|nr:hypothetical protein [Chitinophaga sancti]WPQ61287.1 hypothetical protein SIO70_23295 [Chitinophaga sancti]
MQNKAENLLHTFDETAYVSVNLIYTEFLNSIKHVDRMKNEHTVQLWIGQYMGRLKQGLEGKAKEYISRNRDIPTIDWFQKKIIYLISVHLQEFSQMVRYNQ